jgi:hypothetical protein
LDSTDVEADIKTLGMKRWRLKSLDRKEWTVILIKSRAKLRGREAREEEDLSLHMFPSLL